MMGFGSRIVGTGSFLPSRVVTNQDVSRLLDIGPDYVERVSGIRTRHWVSSGEDCSWLAEQATRLALADAQIMPDDLDAIVLSSTSPDMLFPSTACLLQGRLGITGIPAFDVAASCSGFLYGLSMADCFIRSGQFRRCLVVAAEVKSRSLDLQDLSTAILFGDGAGAAILERSSQADIGVVSVRLHADGAYHDLIKIPGGGSRQPLSPAVLEGQGHTLRIQGSKIYRLAVRQLAQAVKEHVAEEKWELEQLDQVIFHQANGRLIAQVCKVLGTPADRSFSVIENLGNASSASLPIAMDRANRSHRLKSGHRVLLGTFGGGLTWATALVRWG
ncbi:MAG: 3-oxoacyl-ACP synthase III family protein [Nitrospirales bacterium]|nr:ketoacyl-ACP synthase III [Nitrospirales bacterium]